MTPDILTILPNLSIGVVSILALVWVTRSFLMHLKEERELERKERKEDQSALRNLEKEVREKIMKQLGENTRAFDKVFTHIKIHEK